MQISNNNNQTNFGAKMIFIDKGKCFSLKQKLQLKNLAKNIGDSSDIFYVGTRKYDNINYIGQGNHFHKKDMQILSSIHGVNNEHRITHNSVQQKVEKDTSTDFYDLSKRKRWKNFNSTMFEYLKTFLTSFNESVQKNTSTETLKTPKEIRKTFKKDVAEFTSLKRTYYKETLLDKIEKLFSKNTNNTDKKVKSSNEESDFKLFREPEPQPYSDTNSWIFRNP